MGHRDTTLEQAGQALLAHGVPGAIIAVAHGTTERGAEHSAVTGWAQRHVDPPVTMTAAARTDAGSITKIVATTAAAMRLVDAGEIVLDAPAERYLGPLAAGPVSVRELLEHRAGLWEWWPLYLDSPAPDAALARAAQLPPRYRRGTGRHYSDLGFVLLGAVVARVAATALETAVADLVLRPFGLTETRYAHPVDGDVVIASSAGDAIERAMIETGEPYPVQGSVTDFSGWRSYPLVGEVNDGNAYHAFGGCAGHAGLFTTAGDLVRFGRGMLDSLAGRGPVTAPTAREFVAPGADPTQGLGFRVWAGPHGPAVGHTGFPGVAFALLPDQEAVAVMITNRLHAAGPPPPTEPMWELVRGAAHSLLRSRA